MARPRFDPSAETTPGSADWLLRPGRRAPWRTDLAELRRAMTPEELEEWNRLTAGPAVLREIEAEA